MVTSETASRLQKPRPSMQIRILTVGLLAIMGLSACGVGVEDTSFPAAAAASNQQSLVGLDGKPAPYGGENPGPTPDPRGSGYENLPQDPVPIHGPNTAVLVPLTGEPKLTP